MSGRDRDYYEMEGFLAKPRLLHDIKDSVIREKRDNTIICGEQANEESS